MQLSSGREPAANLERAEALVERAAASGAGLVVLPERWDCVGSPDDYRAAAEPLEGGTAAWRAAGLPMEAGETRMLEPPEDVWYKPYDRKAQVEQAMQDYLDWEVALVDKIKRDSDVRFVEFPPA